MIKRLFIANRGEIACRIMRTCQRLGVEVVTCHSDADTESLHVRRSARSMRIGPAPSAQSYLDGAAIIAAALEAGCDAVHPGYGFLSENAEFAKAVETAGLIFVGPSPDTIENMGDKARAKAIMTEAGVATVPGGAFASDDPAKVAGWLGDTGFPALLKPVAGGGGKGMVVLDGPPEGEEIEAAIRTAKASFGDGRLLVERMIQKPRHVEVQVFGDGRGNVVHMFDRECSLQRRHQKVIEEAPATNLPAKIQQEMIAAAVRGAQALKYRNAGTFEFIVDAQGYYFLEVNTRLQVEHPVTEEITGLDLVEWQLRIASGQELPLSQDDIKCQGHAFESRIYAEDPNAGFRPSSGRIVGLSWPNSTRIEAGVEKGSYVSPFYDPMIAKLITRGHDRPSALASMLLALKETNIFGISTNVGFLRKLCVAKDVVEARADTGFIDSSEAYLKDDLPLSDLISATATADFIARTIPPDKGASPWQSGAWAGVSDRSSLDPEASLGRLSYVHDGIEFTACFQSIDEGRVLLQLHDGTGSEIVATSASKIGAIVVGQVGTSDWAATCDPTGIEILMNGNRHRIVAASAIADDTSEPIVRAPLPGVVTALPASVGDRVKKGDIVAVIEAMKMENSLHASVTGEVSELNCELGQQVVSRQVLLVISPRNEEG